MRNSTLYLIGLLIAVVVGIGNAFYYRAIQRDFIREQAQQVFEENLPPGACLFFGEDGIVRWVPIEELTTETAGDAL